MEPQLEWLRGEALLDPSGARQLLTWHACVGVMCTDAALCVCAGVDPWLTAFSVRDLPTTAAGRFEALFAQRQRWTRADIEPYLAVRAACIIHHVSCDCTLSHSD